ncbi:TolC family protein [Flavobacterium sp.]|uniref:TolC family protein n=1 Tax=Flavobacterium sp. TaxID=239 RepID=UPI002D069E30|nr:TolC family protein [Flavobacterium sp.]HQA74027.1 TolC family protein [Flavobacterium sp.]
MNKASFLISLCLFSSFCFAQETNWTLQKCIALGIENNLAIKIQQLEIKRNQKTKVSMLNELLPQVNLYGNQSYNFGSTIDPSTNGRVSSNIQYDNFYLSAQMNLLDFSKIAEAQKDKITIEIVMAEKEIIENEYKLQVLESFYQTLFTQELQKIQEIQLQNSKYNLDRISKEVTIGSKPKSDLYDIQFNYAQEEKRFLETQQLLTIQKTQLFQLINYKDLNIETVVLEHTIANPENDLENLKNPKIKAALLALEKSKKAINFQRANNLPTLSTFYQLASFYYKPLNQPEIVVENFSNQIGNNKNQQVGVQISIPVFNGFKNNRAITAAKIDSEKSKLKIEQEKNSLYQQLELEQKNKKNLESIQAKLIEIENFARASFTTTQAKFTTGVIDVFSYSMAKNNWLTSQYEVIKNKLQLQYIAFKMNLIKTNTL